MEVMNTSCLSTGVCMRGVHSPLSLSLSLSLSLTHTHTHTHTGEGLITYMRTDGVQLSPEAVQGVRSTVSSHFGSKLVSEQPRWGEDCSRAVFLPMNVVGKGRNAFPSLVFDKMPFTISCALQNAFPSLMRDKMPFTICYALHNAFPSLVRDKMPFTISCALHNAFYHLLCVT